MAPLFPAILIGGPAHSGKSTLTYRLSDTLRRRSVPHYALRASPDGEGDWSMTAPAALVAELRPQARGDWSPEFATQISAAIRQRHLPLLVDAGGLVTPETRRIAAHCTHAVLLAADPATLEPWRELVHASGLVLLADLQSSLDGAQQLDDTGPPLCGVISGLSRERDSAGAGFTALVDLLAQICAYTDDELYRSHLALTDVELVLHVEKRIYPLPVRDEQSWQPADLPALLDSLPGGEPLGIYGRGPAWLYAALAAFNAPARCVVFDPRYGWLDLPDISFGVTPDERLSWQTSAQGSACRLDIGITDTYLDPYTTTSYRLMPVDRERGVILSGKLPLWLYATLARAYRENAWVACYQPQLDAAVVVASHGEPAIGQIV